MSGRGSGRVDSKILVNKEGYGLASIYYSNIISNIYFIDTIIEIIDRQIIDRLVSMLHIASSGNIRITELTFYKHSNEMHIAS